MIHKIYTVVGFLICWGSFLYGILSLIDKFIGVEKIARVSGRIWRRTFVFQVYEWNYTRKGFLKIATINELEEVIKWVHNSKRMKTNLFLKNYLKRLEQLKSNLLKTKIALI